MKQQSWIHGIHAVSTAINLGAENILELWVQNSRMDKRVSTLLSEAEAMGLTVQLVDKAQLDKRCSGKHQGVAALWRLPAMHDEATLFAHLAKAPAPHLYLVLDGVTDPHNFGACLRSADAAGVAGVIVPKDRSVKLNPTVINVAVGAAASMPIYAVTNLVRCLRKLQQQGLALIGAAGEAQHSLYQAHFCQDVALVMGAEGEGLRRLTKEACDQLIKIPMLGTVSSLNVSVATGVCLFEVVRQRQL